MNSVLSAIQNNEWEHALELFIAKMNGGKLDEKACIIGATILEHFDDNENLFDLIQTGLKLNPFNYELYIILGNYYAHTNPQKALITYENAYYHALKYGVEDDINTVKGIMDEYKNQYSPSIKNVTILVMHTDKKEFLDQCMHSISENCFEECCKVVPIDISDNENRTGIINNAIQGITDESDILFLNSDVLLTPNALYNLRLALYDSADTGASSAVSNFAHFYQVPLDHAVKTPEDAQRFALVHNIPMHNPYETKCAVDGDFLLIKQEVISKVFPLKTNYLTDGYNFTELCLNIILAGYRNIACWNSFVFRYINQSATDRDMKNMEADRNTFHSKWGFMSEYYMGIRNELVNLIKEDEDAPISVLEVGAGMGTTLLNIKYRYPNAHIKGIELVDKVVDIAANYVNIECANIENYQFADDEQYDYIIFGDVLEHLLDPYSLVDRIKNNLKANGCIITSIPNILNGGVIYKLLHGDFNYEDSGILDRTHLRFFTQNSVVKLFTERGYDIVEIFGLPDPQRSTLLHKDFFDKLLSIDGIVEKSQFDIFQYVVCARKHGN